MILMQISAIVKEFCTDPREISLLHNHGRLCGDICGLTISILFFYPSVNETDYEEVLRLRKERACCSILQHAL